MTVERNTAFNASSKELHERGVIALEKIGNNMEELNTYVKDFMGFILDEIEQEKAYVKSLNR
jgi:hypothetical protein